LFSYVYESCNPDETDSPLIEKRKHGRQSGVAAHLQLEETQFTQSLLGRKAKQEAYVHLHFSYIEFTLKFLEPIIRVSGIMGTIKMDNHQNYY